MAETIAAAAASAGVPTPMTTPVVATATLPQARAEAEATVDEESDDEGSRRNRENGVVSSGQWNPIHWVCSWRDRRFRERYTIVVLLPSGITDGEHFEVRMLENARDIQLKVMWPSLFVMVEDMARVCGKDVMCDSKLIAMGMEVCEMQRELVSGQMFNSSCRLRMPKEIESVDAVIPIGSTDGTRLLTIDLIVKGDYGGRVSTGKFILLESKKPAK